MKPRLCPHCKSKIGIDKGFDFDDNLNLVCTACRNIAFSTVKSPEKPDLVPCHQISAGFTHQDNFPFHDV